MKKKRRRKARFSHEKRNIFIFLFFLFFMGMGYSVLGTSLGLGGTITILYPRDPIIKATSSIDSTAFRKSTYKEKIKIINLDDEINPPANVIESWDISESQTGNVMAYITQNQANSNYYDLYIQGDGHLYANPDSSYLFANLKGVDAINNIEVLDTSRVTNMSRMFSFTGYNSKSFALDLGDNFDTSNVTNMSYMFFNTGFTSTSFNLNLGNKFNTSNVTNMAGMFDRAGVKSAAFTLDLGDKFDTRNVTDMHEMFRSTGQDCTVFNLNLREKFDTRNVTNMKDMFGYMGYYNTNMETDLSQLSFDSVTSYDKIFLKWRTTQTIFVKDITARNWIINNSGNSELTTSNVLIKGAYTIQATNVNDTSKFRNSQYRDKIHNIYLSSTISVPNNVVDSWDISKLQDGSVMAYLTSTQTDIYDLYIQGDGRLYANPNSSYLFANLKGVDSINNMSALDTSYVTSMNFMFYYTGYNSTTFTLDLGNNFDTSNVTSMVGMFSDAGYNSSVFTLKLRDKFDTSNVINMESMFARTGRNSAIFTLSLGDHFDTSNTKNMFGMFHATGYSSPVFTLELGDKFNTSQVINMESMFNMTGFSSTVFTLDLGDSFDTRNVTNMESMFTKTGSASTVFTLDLGNKFDTSQVTTMMMMFFQMGSANTALELDLSTFTFNPTSYSLIFGNWTSTQKIYVKDTIAQDWILNNSGNSNLTSSNVLIKS